MKKLLFGFFLSVCLAMSGNTQQCVSGSCSNFINQFPSGTFTPTTSWSTLSGMNGGNWTLFNVICGNTYDFTYCEAYGGISTSWDAQLTLYNYITGALLCFSDDNCGTTGKGPYIRWTSNFTGTVRLLTSVFSGGSCHSNGPSGPYNRLAYEISNAPTSSVTLTVFNVIGGIRSNAKVLVYNSDYSQLLQTVFTNASGQAAFAPLNNGSYNYEVYYTPSGNNPPVTANQEFWGNAAFSICSGGQSIPLTFTRIQPYLSSAPVFSSGSLMIGQSTNGSFPVRNALPYTTNSYVEVWVDRDQTNPFDYHSAASSQSIGSGVTTPFSFNVSPANTGAYLFYAFVYSFVNNQYIVTDQYAWTSAFTTTCPFLGAPTSASPGSGSAPGTVLTTLTPTFTWGGNTSGIYHIQIWDAATNPANSSNVIYGFETPASSPGHCIFGLSHTLPSGVLVNNGQYKWSVHRNDPCGECESFPTTTLYFQVNTNSCLSPNTQANNISFLSVGPNQFTINCNAGNGTKRILKINTINSFTDPVNGVDPPANSIYQNSGEQVIYNGTGTSGITVTNLSSGTTYWVRAYEANCSGGTIVFNTSTANLNPASQPTSSALPPVADFSTSNGTVIVGGSATLHDLSSNGPNTLSWLVDREEWNGSYTTVAGSTQSNPTFTFNTAACYRVTLTATNGAGSNSLTRQCYIYATPNLNATIPPDVTRAQQYYTYKGGDPVNLANGSFSFSMKDLSLPGVKTVLNLERRYFSNDATEGNFGTGWHSSFDIKLDLSNSFDWALQYPDGHNEHYVPYKNGETRTLYPGNFDTLSYTASGSTLNSFTLTQKDGTQWNFNSSGQIVSIVDLDGNQTNFNYSGGQLNLVTLPGGRFFQFTYNAFNKVATATDNSNRTVYYFYDPTDHHLDSTRIGNSTTSFRYGASGMTEVYDPRGNRILQNAYDAQGRVVQQYNSENKLTGFQYDTPVAGTVTVTDPTGKSKQVTHDSQARCTRVKDELNNSTGYTYSQNNTLDIITDARNFQTTIIHDAKGNPVMTTNAKGFSDSIHYSSLNKPDYIKDREGNVTTTNYSPTGNPTQVTLPTGDILIREYDGRGLDTTDTDARGFKTKKIYNSNGDVIQTITPTSVTSISYDAAGRPVEITDSYGRKDSLFWNYFDQLIGRKDKMGFMESFGYDENGNQVSHTDKKGQVTTTQFTRFDKPLTIIEPQNHLTGYVYDDNQRLIKIRDANKNTKIISYDDAGREVSVADSVLGTLSQKTYDAAGNIITRTDALGKTWTNRVDEINRITSTVNPLGDSIQYKYNKNDQPIQQTDEEGKSVTWDYDAMGRQVKATDARNNYVQKFLNKNGLVDSVRDARGNIRNKAIYDGSGRMLTLNDGFGNYTMSWDSTDHVKTITDPDNRTLNYFYDANSELLDVKNGAPTLRHYVLDNSGEFTQANSSTLNASFNRNQLGWVIQFSDNFSNTTGHIYDSVGNTIKINYPGGKVAEYTYNSLNKCIKVKDWNNQVYTITRNNNGDITAILYPNNLKAEITRDDASRVNAWVNKDNNNTIFQSDLLLRSRAGDIMRDSGMQSLPFIVLPQSTSGTYRPDDRINIYGNAICSTSASGERKNLNAPGKSYSYTWSPMSELVNTTQTTAAESMQYDAFNERATKTTASNSIRYITDQFLAPFPVVLQERNSANQEIINYLYIPGDGIVLARDSAGVSRYYHHDVKGNTIALSDPSQQITDRYAYTELGDSIYHTGGSTQPFTWMGMYGGQNDGNGLYYLHARYYDGKTGTFISKDPNPVNYLNTQDIDRYVYGYNNPLKFTDPTGLVSQNNISYDRFLFNPNKLSAYDPSLSFWENTRRIWDNAWQQAMERGLNALADPKNLRTALGLVLLDADMGDLGLLDDEAALSTNFIASPDGFILDLNRAIDRISSGDLLQFKSDGSIFKNSEGLLPKQSIGYYNEFVYPTPGIMGKGAIRIVTGQGGEAWLTLDHYETFIPIR